LQLRRFVRRFGVTRLAGNRPGFSLSRAPASKLEEVALAWRWCQESSQKRYLSALKQLALVRKLKPALSPLEAMRPVNEGPVSGRAGSNRAGVRLAGVE
jgi:hypothetical protein